LYLDLLKVITVHIYNKAEENTVEFFILSFSSIFINLIFALVWENIIMIILRHVMSGVIR